jgi:hypothetical protein
MPADKRTETAIARQSRSMEERISDTTDAAHADEMIE